MRKISCSKYILIMDLIIRIITSLISAFLKRLYRVSHSGHLYFTFSVQATDVTGFPSELRSQSFVT